MLGSEINFFLTEQSAILKQIVVLLLYSRLVLEIIYRGSWSCSEILSEVLSLLKKELFVNIH